MKCGSEIPNSDSPCSKCYHQYKKSPDHKTMYNVPNGHPENIPSIKLGKIIGVNPNSHINIQKVLDQFDKSDECTLIRVGFDGTLKDC